MWKVTKGMESRKVVEVVWIISMMDFFVLAEKTKGIHRIVMFINHRGGWPLEYSQTPNKRWRRCHIGVLTWQSFKLILFIVGKVFKLLIFGMNRIMMNKKKMEKSLYQIIILVKVKIQKKNFYRYEYYLYISKLINL